MGRNNECLSHWHARFAELDVAIALCIHSLCPDGDNVLVLGIMRSCEDTSPELPAKR